MKKKKKTTETLFKSFFSTKQSKNQQKITYVSKPEDVEKMMKFDKAIQKICLWKIEQVVHFTESKLDLMF